MILDSELNPIVTVKQIDQSYMHIDCTEAGVLYDLDTYFSFYTPGFKYSPLFLQKKWDGKTHLMKLRRKLIPVGLKDRVKTYCQEHKYSFVDESDIAPVTNDLTAVPKFIESIKLPFAPRYYQLNAFQYALYQNRGLILSPTGSGKSLVIYLLARWHYEAGKKLVIIVPSTSLIEQIISDFKDYSINDETFDVDKVVGSLYSKSKRRTDPYTIPILVSTWQSLVNYDKELFETFEVTIVDECHLFKSKVASKAALSCTEAKVKIGFSGSLSGNILDEYTLISVFGEIYQVTTTKELQDQGSLAPLSVYMINLKYSKEHVKEYYKFCEAKRIAEIDAQIQKMRDNKVFELNIPSREELLSEVKTKIKYLDEVDYLMNNSKRNLLIRNLALKCKGTTLILFNRKDHGKELFRLISEAAGEDRKVFHIDGDVDPNERESIRNTINEGKNCILVASIQTSATGINIPSMENLIMFPSKSRIRGLQSLGRILRVQQGKNVCNCFVIVDEFGNYRRCRSYSVRHASEQYEIFMQQQFPVSFKTLDDF